MASADTSLLIKPIELGSPTVIQLLDARANVTKEILGYLEQECEAILECKYCKSLFRSLANFISHKRVYCQGIYQDLQPLFRAGLVNHTESTTVVQPTDPSDAVLSAKSNAKPAENARRSIAPNRKARPVRKTAPADLAKITDGIPALSLTSIEEVTCAVSQVAAGGDEDGGRSSVTASTSSKVEVITTVQPKDGYANMSLRQRTTATDKSLINLDHWLDIEEDNKHTKSSSAARSKQVSSKAAMTEILSKRSDCDVNLMKCLLCNSTFATAKTLNFHMLNKHSEQRKLYPCIYCKNVFTQFWGVTRHLKRAHGLAGDNIDRIREQIRARVYTDTSCASTATRTQSAAATQKRRTAAAQKSARGPEASGGDTPVTILKSNLTNNTSGKKRGSSADKSTKSSFCCNVCSKEFPSSQSLSLHVIACYKKAGMDPPLSRRQLAAQQAKTPKPLLFVCKTCNRAFSLRHNMVQHASACTRRQKEGSGNNSNKAGISPSSESEMSSKQNKQDKVNVATKKDKNEATPIKVEETSAEPVADEKKSTGVDGKKASGKVSQSTFDTDDILLQLSPSDEAKQEEEMSITPPSTPTSLALSRARRTVKPKQFSDGTIRLIEKVPEVVKIQQSDGSLVYKLREDVEPDTEIATPSKMSEEDEEVEIIKAKNTKNMLPLVLGEAVPLLDAEHEGKIGRMIDKRKLVCLKCKRQYGSISNLRRHAVRHLGWRRYKCKLCKFTSYNKSECKGHLRKTHESDVATLLDGGLAPYIVDLGALLDDDVEHVGSAVLSITFPADDKEEKTASTSCKANGTSKEPGSESEYSTADNTKPESQSSEQVEEDSDSKKIRGRRKRPASSTKFIPTASSSSTKSTTSSTDEGNVYAVRSRGRAPRKQQLQTLSNSDLVPPPQDENNKRHRSRPTKAIVENGDSGPPSPKVARVYKVVESLPDPVRQKEANSKLEGLLNKLRTVRKPLIGAEDNSKSGADNVGSNVVSETKNAPEVVSVTGESAAVSEHT